MIRCSCRGADRASGELRAVVLSAERRAVELNHSLGRRVWYSTNVQRIEKEGRS
jgi:hypothetical protein